LFSAQPSFQRGQGLKHTQTAMVIFEKAVSTASTPGVTSPQMQRFVRQAQAFYPP